MAMTASDARQLERAFAQWRERNPGVESCPGCGGSLVCRYSAGMDEDGGDTFEPVVECVSCELWQEIDDAEGTWRDARDVLWFAPDKSA